jgi:hypothetical protein
VTKRKDAFRYSTERIEVIAAGPENGTKKDHDTHSNMFRETQGSVSKRLKNCVWLDGQSCDELLKTVASTVSERY